MRVSNHAVRVDSDELSEGASLTINRLALLDYGSLVNALFTHATPPDAAVASFRLRWSGKTDKTSANDAGPNRFQYEGIRTKARLSWSATNPSQHFAFKSDPASTSFETFAALVNERNGSLFGSDSDD